MRGLGAGALAGWGARAARKHTRDAVIVAGVAVVNHAARHHPRMLEDALKIVRVGIATFSDDGLELRIRRLGGRDVATAQRPWGDGEAKVWTQSGPAMVPTWPAALRKVDDEIDRQGLTVIGWAEVLRG